MPTNLYILERFPPLFQMLNELPKKFVGKDFACVISFEDKSAEFAVD